jgi:hypothetical protein
MKELFFFAMLLVLPATIFIALLYSLAKYLYTVYEDRRELKELDAIQAESAARREQNREDNAQRLNNGCQHAFDHGTRLPARRLSQVRDRHSETAGGLRPCLAAGRFNRGGQRVRQVRQSLSDGILIA